jgi:hypothetical protein
MTKPCQRSCRKKLRNDPEKQEQLLHAAARRASEKLMENYNKKRAQ